MYANFDTFSRYRPPFTDFRVNSRDGTIIVLGCQRMRPYYVWDIATRSQRNRLVELASAHNIEAMAGQGSAGNVLAALCSFFIPGLGQLLQGRLLMAIVQFCLAAILWFVLLGWVIHLWSILDAALFKPTQ
jgi:hypothetical protein